MSFVCKSLNAKNADLVSARFKETVVIAYWLQPKENNIEEHIKTWLFTELFYFEKKNVQTARGGREMYA